MIFKTNDSRYYIRFGSRDSVEWHGFILQTAVGRRGSRITDVDGGCGHSSSVGGHTGRKAYLGLYSACPKVYGPFDRTNTKLGIPISEQRELLSEFMELL